MGMIGHNLPIAFLLLSLASKANADCWNQNKYLDGYAGGYRLGFVNSRTAKRKCLEKSTCKGITRETNREWTLRASAVLKDSSSGEVSELRSCFVKECGNIRSDVGCRQYSYNCGSEDMNEYCSETCGLCGTCKDGEMNSGETGIDCGGPCDSCEETTTTTTEEETCTGDFKEVGRP